MTDQQATDGGDFEPLPENAACSLCEYSYLVPVLAADGSPVIGEQQRICRRFPPTAVLIPIQTPQGSGAHISPYFPPVADNMFCAEFFERDQPEIKPTTLVS